MQKNTIKRLLALLIFTFFTTILSAQPGGPGGPPPSGPPPGGFPGGPRGNERQMQQAQQRGSSVRQRRIKTAGTTYKVVGTLIDSSKNEALVYVNVTLLTKEDSSFVKGAISDMNGYFEVKEVPAGEYYLRVSYVGYLTRFIPVTVTNNTALGAINMRQGAAQLRTVKITAARPLYSMEGEKMIYNVADDPSIQSGTTTDALQNAPGVEVDIEGNITLRGVSSVEIWVNDKPSKLTAENLKTYLETLPANALDRIETITNPSAKYATDADAVINIITSAHIKKNHFISFGVNAATQPNFGPWLSYTWANEKLSINFFAGGRFSNRQSDATGWSRTYDKDPLHPNDTNYRILAQQDTSSSRSFSRNVSGNFGLNIDYEIDSTSDIGFWSNFNFDNSGSYDSVWYRREMITPAASIYQYNQANNQNGLSIFGMFGGNYTKKFDKWGHNLRVFMFGNVSGGHNYTNYSRIFTQTDTADQYNQNTYKYYDNSNHSTNLNINARYNRPYSQNGEMSYGLGYNLSNSERDYRPYLLAEAYVDGVTILDETLYDALRRYVYSNLENSVSADVNWTHRWGGFTLQLGMGARLTNSNFSYSETITLPGDEFSKFYITYNPSIHLSYRTEAMHNFKLSYTLRMRNPSGSQLTTFRTYTEDSYSTGNRDLGQSYTHNAEAGWTKFYSFGSIGLEGYGRLSTGEIDNLTDITDAADAYIGRIISYSTPYNIGSSWRYGASLNATYRPSGFFNLRLYANLYDYGYSMQYDKLGQEPYTASKWSYSFRLNMWTKVFNKYQIHASANYSSPTLGLMSVRSARYWVNCGVRADFFNRKLSAFVNIQDIFNWGKKIGNSNANTNPYYQSGSLSRTLNSRYISAGFTLRFGKMELERNNQSGSESEGTETTTTTLTTE